MDFKYTHTEEEFINAPKVLQQLICDVDKYSRENFGKDIVITRILGKIKGDSGVHTTYRAFDSRDEHNGEFMYTEDERKEIVNWVNTKYKRIDGYKTCLWHGKTKHFHFQLPARLTDLRSETYRDWYEYSNCNTNST